jgi:hypothetical protein
VKTISKIQWLILPFVLCARLTGGAQPVKTPPAKPAPIRSTFIIPASPQEGRDPFFPESTRVYEVAVAAAASQVVEVTTLVVKGFSIINGHPMVIINNHSFTINDEGDVLTPGGRVHVRCLDIKPSVAIIEANGHRQDLHF